MASERPRPVLGALWMVAACLCFATLAALGHHLGQSYSPFEIVFFRNLFMLAAFVPLLLARTRRETLKTRRSGAHFARAVVGLAALYAFYFSVAVLPIAEATALSFTVPLFMILVSIPLLGERVGLHRWAATLLGFGGVLLILRPGVVPLSPGALLALFSAAGFALSMGIIKLLAPTDSPGAIVFYQALFMAPLSALPAAFFWRTPELSALGLLVAVGLVSAAAQFGLARSLALAESTAVAPLDFTRLPFAAALGFLFFGDVPDLWTWLGAAVIVASSVYIAHREARAPRPTAAAGGERRAG